MALTPAGRELVGPLERVLVDLRAIADQAHDLVSRPRGIVTVACLPSVAASVMPRAIAALTAQHHGIVVRTHDVVAERVLEMVRSGEADFGVGNADRVDRKVTAQPLIHRIDSPPSYLAGHALARGGTSPSGSWPVSPSCSPERTAASGRYSSARCAESGWRSRSRRR